MFCENCGNKLLDEAKFCGGCGAKIEPEPPTYEAPIQPAPAYYVQTKQQGYAPPQSVSHGTPPQIGAEPLRVGQYIGMFLLMCVPLLNIILLFMWSFGGSVNLNKRNFARASLILSAVSLIFIFIGSGVIMAAL